MTPPDIQALLALCNGYIANEHLEHEFATDAEMWRYKDCMTLVHALKSRLEAKLRVSVEVRALCDEDLDALPLDDITLNALWTRPSPNTVSALVALGAWTAKAKDLQRALRHIAAGSVGRVTPEMIEAGRKELYCFCSAFDSCSESYFDEAVTAVYRAMSAASRAALLTGAQEASPSD